MRKIRLNQANLSELIWSQMMDFSYHEYTGNYALHDHFARLESLRVKATYNTGSISQSAQFALYSLSNFFQPTFIAEVGTFIGKSLVAMMAPNMTHRLWAHTCDYSNDIRIPIFKGPDVDGIFMSPVVRQHPMKSSVYMFKNIIEGDVEYNFDRILFNLDGRVENDDIKLIKEIINGRRENTIFALDDFEGIEKGVANYEKLKGLLPNHWLVYPPTSLLLSKYGYRDYCSTALVIPDSMIIKAVQ